MLSMTMTTPPRKATVWEFDCIFSHDVRRKNTKRWQDGRCSFHTFNGKVAVYDTERNYIGDAYRDALDDGDEFLLDCAVIVQVGERKGAQETDLTELLKRPALKNVQARVQAMSPFEQRKRPLKKRRVEEHVPLSKILGTDLDEHPLQQTATHEPFQLPAATRPLQLASAAPKKLFCQMEPTESRKVFHQEVPTTPQDEAASQDETGRGQAFGEDPPSEPQDEVGPWTREAWDLFGTRHGITTWDYDV